jgi:pimeloyl-ACP methyl ester carboxylesterase
VTDTNVRPAALAERGFLALPNQSLEYRFIGPPPEAAPTLVMLHEGLGCVGLWSDFPDKLAAATGAGVVVFSRAGYGASSPVPLPRPLSYMHDEARATMPALLDAIGFRRGILIGHSDGASIAAIYAGSHDDRRLRGISLIAPHFIVEDICVESIAQAKIAYETTDLRGKLARWHKNVDVAFWGWNGAWLDPEFKKWDIREYLPYIRVPIQIVQGEDDQYGTFRQIEIAQEECKSPVDVTMLPGVKHSPHREAPDRALAAVAGFCNRILNGHGEEQRHDPS